MQYRCPPSRRSRPAAWAAALLGAFAAAPVPAQVPAVNAPVPGAVAPASPAPAPVAPPTGTVTFGGTLGNAPAVTVPPGAPALPAAAPAPGQPPAAAVPAPAGAMSSAPAPAPPPVFGPPMRPGAGGRPRTAAPPALPTVPTAPVTGLPPDAPKLVINGGVYSPTAARRRVIVNGQVVKEGADLGQGAVLEQIRPASVVIGFRGTSYHVTY